MSHAKDEIDDVSRTRMSMVVKTRKMLSMTDQTFEMQRSDVERGEQPLGQLKKLVTSNGLKKSRDV